MNQKLELSSLQKESRFPYARKQELLEFFVFDLHNYNGEQIFKIEPLK